MQDDDALYRSSVLDLEKRGAAAERARIRRELELWLDAQEDIGGDLEDRFLAALDRVCPQETV